MPLAPAVAPRRCKNLTDVVIVHRCIRRSEHRMIERVLGFEANFKIHLLAYVELLSQRQIGGERPRAAYAAQRTRSILQREVVGAHESRVVVGGVADKVLIYEIRPVIALGRPHDVGTLRAVGGNWISAFDVKGQRPCVGNSPDAVRLPPADDQFCPPGHIAQECPPAPERQIVASQERTQAKWTDASTNLRPMPNYELARPQAISGPGTRVRSTD